jgi:CO/xanthine dehydrogenase Mo-binding subunit
MDLDVLQIDVFFNDIPDEHTSLDERGIGEIGIMGVAATIANSGPANHAR